MVLYEANESSLFFIITSGLNAFRSELVAVEDVQHVVGSSPSSICWCCRQHC